MCAIHGKKAPNSMFVERLCIISLTNCTYKCVSFWFVNKRQPITMSSSFHSISYCLYGDACSFFFSAIIFSFYSSKVNVRAHMYRITSAENWHHNNIQSSQPLTWASTLMNILYGSNGLHALMPIKLLSIIMQTL